MGPVRRAVSLAWLCGAVAVACAVVPLSASPQEPSETAGSLTRLKQRLDRPTGKPLKPSEPVQLRPIFRSRSVDRPFVPTLEEHLHKTFDLTDFQRQYAMYAASCCGIDLGALFGKVERALDERRERRIREEIARELAFVEAAQVKPIR